ncbi:MAG: ERCC4 domain-containing protein [Deltaproteobacteria bacterium]|nr:ERCC4 domain-containing protein [Deltaproteobacteria bacterium]
MSKLLAKPQMIIIQDSREQHPFSFSGIRPRPIIEVAGLQTGDYSIKGLENDITIERKSLPDLFGSVGQARARFEREFGRMSELKYAAVVCEGDWWDVFKNPPARSRMEPKSVYATLIAWTQRYGIHFWPCPNRQFAEKTTYRLLERYWRDRQI